MNLRAHFHLLDDGISRLLRDLPTVPTDDHNAIRHFIDHDEYGLAFELLMEAVAEHGIALTDEQSSEAVRVAKLMDLPSP